MASNNLTNNINMLSPAGFKLTINKEKFSNIEFFLTTFTIPDITLTPVELSYKGFKSYEAGEPRSFGELSLRFAIDEDMKNYTEIYDWLKRCSEESAVNSQIEAHDMILSVMSNHNNLNKQFQFKDAFPTSLGGVEFTTQGSDIEYLQADVSFRYNEFTIIR